MPGKLCASGLAAVLAAGPALAAGALPSPVAEAFAVAQARMEPKQRWAFTCSQTLYEETGGVVKADYDTVVARYDPRRPEGDEWRLVSPPSEDALTDGQRHVWESLPSTCRSIDADPTPRREGCRTRPSFVPGPRRISRSASRVIEPPEVRTPTAAPLETESRVEDGGEVERIVVTASCGGREPPPTQWEELAKVLGDVTLIEESPAEQVYAFRLDPPGVVQSVLMKPLVRHFRGEIAIAAAEPKLVRLRFHARPFRVPGLARVNELDIVLHFDEVEPGGPIAVTRMEQHGRAHAVRQGMESHGATVVSDFERVEAPAEP